MRDTRRPLERIALVAPYDYAYPGGVRTHIDSLARTYEDMGLYVRVIAASSATETPPELLIKATSTTVPVVYSGSKAYISFSALAYGRIREVLDREQFDVIHLHEPLTPTVPLSTLLHSQTLNVGTFHAYRAGGFSFYQPAKALVRIMDKLDGRIAVSTAARDYVSRYFPGDYTIIPNGINYEYLSAPDAKRIAQFDDGRPNILFVGRLDPRKGFVYLLEAYEQVKRAVPEVRLIAVGGFTPEDAFEHRQFIEERRLPGVHLIGRVSDEELRSYYHTADIVCVPSTGFESFGYILVEGMAAGKPVVASNIPGYSFVLQHDVQGLLVPPEDARPIAEALITLLRDPDRRAAMGAAGRVRAAGFSWSVVARQILDFYATQNEKRKRREAAWSPTS